MQIRSGAFLGLPNSAATVRAHSAAARDVVAWSHRLIRGDDVRSRHSFNCASGDLTDARLRSRLLTLRLHGSLLSDVRRRVIPRSALARRIRTSRWLLISRDDSPLVTAVVALPHGDTALDDAHACGLDVRIESMTPRVKPSTLAGSFGLRSASSTNSCSSGKIIRTSVRPRVHVSSLCASDCGHSGVGE